MLFTWLSTPIIPIHASSYPIFVFHTSYASKAVYYRDGHTPPQNMSVFATALKTSHQTTPWNICLHFWSCFRMSLRAMDNPLREWDPAQHLSWYTEMGVLAVARSHSPFFHSPLEHCQYFPSQVKASAAVPLLRAAAHPWAQTLFHNSPYNAHELSFSFVSGQTTSLVLFVLNVHEFCLEKKNPCLWSPSTSTLPA